MALEFDPNEFDNTGDSFSPPDQLDQFDPNEFDDIDTQEPVEVQTSEDKVNAAVVRGTDFENTIKQKADAVEAEDKERSALAISGEGLKNTFAVKTAKSIVAGQMQAAEGVFNTMIDVGNVVEEHLGLDFISNDFKFDASKFLFPKDEEEIAQNLLRTVSSFVGIFGATSKAVQGVKALNTPYAKIALASAADVIALDPDEGTFSDVISKMFPSTDPALSALFLTTKEDDSQFVKRAKIFGDSLLLNSGLSVAAIGLLTAKGLGPEFFGKLVHKSQGVFDKARKLGQDVGILKNAEEVADAASKKGLARKEATAALDKELTEAQRLQISIDETKAENELLKKLGADENLDQLRKDVNQGKRDKQAIDAADNSLGVTFKRKGKEIGDVKAGRQRIAGAKDSEVIETSVIGTRLSKTVKEFKEEVFKKTGIEATPEQVKAVMKRNIVADQQVLDAGKNISKDSDAIEKLYDRATGTGITAEEGAAMTMDYIENTFNPYIKLITTPGFESNAKLVKKADELLDEAMMKNFSIEAGNSELGRGLRAVRSVNDRLLADAYGTDNPEILARIKTLLRQSRSTVEGGLKQRAKAEIHRGMKRIQELDKSTVDAFGKLVFDYSPRFSSWTNAMNSHFIGNLFSLTSVVSNLAGNSANSMIALLDAAVPEVERLAMRTIGKEQPFAGMLTLQQGEAEALARGYKDSFFEGLRNTKKLFKELDVSNDFRVKFQGIGAKDFDAKIKASYGDSVAGRGAFAITKAFSRAVSLGSIGTKSLASTDGFFRTIALHGRARQLAHRDALTKGFRFGDKEYTKALQSGTRNPTVEREKEIISFADKQLFTEPFVDVAGQPNIAFGGLLSDIERGVKRMPFYSTVAPFWRVGGNMANYSVERFPLIRQLNPGVADALKRGEGAAFEEAQNKMLVGMGLLSMGGVMAANGLITGDMPYAGSTRQGLAEGGYLADRSSMMLGDTVIPLSIFGPPGMMYGAGATLQQAAGHSNDMDMIENMTHAMAFSVMGLFKPSMFDFGLPEFMEIVEGVDNEKPLAAQIGKFVGRAGSTFMMSNMVTSIRNYLAGSRSSVFSQKDESPYTNAMNAFTDEFKKIVSIPGLTDDAPMVNIFGDTIGLPPGMGLGYIEGTHIEEPGANRPSSTNSPERMKTRKLNVELKRLSLISPNAVAATQAENRPFRISMPKKNIITSVNTGIGSGAKTTIAAPLTPKLYYEYTMLAAGHEIRGIKAFGRGTIPLKDTLINMITTPNYKKANDEVRKIIIHDIIRSYRKQATAAMKTFPEINYEINESFNNRAKGLGVPVDLKVR